MDLHTSVARVVEWDLDLSPHLIKRMADRRFTELDLREMLEEASRCQKDVVEGRWVVKARHRGRSWHVIVEPDTSVQLLVVVTAYPIG